MKISKYLFGSILLFMIGIMPASAQFSILPVAGSDVNCADILQKYELTGKIPTKAETDNSVQKAQNQAQAAKDDYKAAEQAYEQAQGEADKLAQNMDPKAAADCYNDSSSLTCQNLEKKQQQAAELQQKADDAKQQSDQAQQNSDQVASDANKSDKSKTSDRDTLLACGIKTGRISLQMVPFFITRIADFILSFVGLLCVLFIVIGGYQYIVGGLTDQKEKGKNTIKHALMGMSLAILSWVIVTAIMNAITG